MHEASGTSAEESFSAPGVPGKVSGGGVHGTNTCGFRDDANFFLKIQATFPGVAR